MTKKSLKNREIEFGVSKKILSSIIRRQAGTLKKAIFEGVQNAVDANADEINIEIESDKVVIRDNGSGMTEEVITNVFSTFGESTKDEEKNLGHFGIGRGQMFCFGKTNIYTNKFKIVVDLETKMGFDLYEVDQIRKGTTVIIELSKLLGKYDINSIIYDLRNELFFPDIDVRVNDNPIIKKKKALTLSELETQNFAVYEGDGKIYLQGIFVKYSKCSYDILIKNPIIKVNMSRNSFIQDDELVDFQNKVNLHEIKHFDKRTAYTKTKRIMNLLLSKKLDISEVSNLKFIKDGSGSFRSVNFYAEKNRPIKNLCYLNESEKASVASYAQNMGFEVIDMPDDFNEVINEVSDINVTSLNHKKVVEMVDKQTQNIEIVKIDPKENQGNFFRLQAMCGILSYIAGETLSVPYRKVKFVKNAAYVASTLPEVYISFNTDDWDLRNTTKTLGSIVQSIIHEYAHREVMMLSTELSHGPEFDARYRKYSCKLLPVLMEVILKKREHLKKVWFNHAYPEDSTYDLEEVFYSE